MQFKDLGIGERFRLSKPPYSYMVGLFYRRRPYVHRNKIRGRNWEFNAKRCDGLNLPERMWVNDNWEVERV